MKRLLLLRHGKSDWDNHLTDVERPIMQHAYKDAELVARAFQEKSTYSFSIFSSKAVRARTTATIFAEKLANQVDNFEIYDHLYTFDPNAILETISALPNTLENCMLVGHNPAYTQLINYFCQEAGVYNLPTTGLAEMTFETNDWKGLIHGQLTLLLLPKNLRKE